MIAGKGGDWFGAGRHAQQDIAAKVGGVLDFLPGLGEVLGADDTAREMDAGKYGGAAVAAAATGLGMLPAIGDFAGKGLKSLASRSAFMYNPPARSPRPFEADYPAGAKVDETGKLLEDIEGRPLVAEHVAGRRVVGGADQPLRPDEVVTAAAAATGGRPEAVARGSKELGRDVGRYVVTRDRRSGQVTGRDIFYDRGLPSSAAGSVITHELGHAIDEISGNIPTSGLNDELRAVYNDLNNPQSHGRRFGPEQSGYKGENVGRELVAEATRAYATNPNYLKTVAPKTAERIRQYVNDHPDLRRIIQFNSIIAAPAAGVGLLDVGGRDDF